MAMFILTMQDVELLLDCVTQSRSFQDFESRGLESLQASVMEIKNDLEQQQESGNSAASLVVYSIYGSSTETKNPEPKEKKLKKKEVIEFNRILSENNYIDCCGCCRLCQMEYICDSSVDCYSCLIKEKCKRREKE